MDCPSELPGNSSLRKLLPTPTARAQVTQTLFDVTWAFRVPTATKHNVQRSSPGNLPRRSWRSGAYAAASPSQSTWFVLCRIPGSPILRLTDALNIRPLGRGRGPRALVALRSRRPLGLEPLCPCSCSWKIGPLPTFLFPFSCRYSR
jgi:hypothetical protein